MPLVMGVHHIEGSHYVPVDANAFARIRLGVMMWVVLHAPVGRRASG